MASREDKIDKVARLVAGGIKTAMGFADMVGETIEALGEEIESHLNEDEPVTEEPVTARTESKEEHAVMRNILLPDYSRFSVRRDYDGPVYFLSEGSASYHIMVKPNQSPVVTKLNNKAQSGS